MDAILRNGQDRDSKIIFCGTGLGFSGQRADKNGTKRDPAILFLLLIMTTNIFFNFFVFLKKKIFKIEFYLEL